jgi:hypothetical protein
MPHEALNVRFGEAATQYRYLYRRSALGRIG